MLDVRAPLFVSLLLACGQIETAELRAPPVADENRTPERAVCESLDEAAQSYELEFSNGKSVPLCRTSVRARSVGPDLVLETTTGAQITISSRNPEIFQYVRVGDELTLTSHSCGQVPAESADYLIVRDAALSDDRSAILVLWRKLPHTSIAMNDLSLRYAPAAQRCGDLCTELSASSVVATNLLERSEVVTLLPAEQKELGRYVVGTDPMELTTECEPLDLGGYVYARR